MREPILKRQIFDPAIAPMTRRWTALRVSAHESRHGPPPTGADLDVPPRRIDEPKHHDVRPTLSRLRLRGDRPLQHGSAHRLPHRIVRTTLPRIRDLERA